MQDYAPPQTVAGTQSTLSNWAGPYVTDMLGKGWALSETPYQPYTGKLTAGPSALQDQAFSGIANLALPDSYADASRGLGEVADAAAGMNYSPGSYGNYFSRPDAFLPGNYGNNFNTPGNLYSYEAGTFTNQFESPDAMYTAGDISTNRWGEEWTDRYMNPYVDEVVSPQLREARRQAEISRLRDAGRLTQAGAFGGSRQAIMESELNRNLMQEMSDIVGEGYARAYDNAQGIFTSDEDRLLRAGIEQERARERAGDQGLRASELSARYGLAALENQERAKQAEGDQALSAAEAAARYGLSGDQLSEDSRQFGARYGLDSASEAARYAMSGDEMTEQSRQFGANYGLDALRQRLEAENARANMGINELAGEMDILEMLGRYGQQQRDIEQEGISADYAQFRQEQEYPYEQLKFMQSLLDGLPIASRDVNYNDLSLLQEILGGGGAAASLIREILDAVNS